MTSHLAKNLEKIFSEVDTWELAAQMVAEYREAKKFVTGGAETRKIARMQVIVKAMMDEIRHQVERAEQESE